MALIPKNMFVDELKTNLGFTHPSKSVEYKYALMWERCSFWKQSTLKLGKYLLLTRKEDRNFVGNTVDLVYFTRSKDHCT